MKLLHFSLLILILVVLASGARGQVQPPTQSRQQRWCVASEQATAAALQEALDWACSTEGGANCTLIQPSGICYIPDTLKDHASYAFNDYWQKYKGLGGTCDFKGSALLVDDNPSHDLCIYPESA